MKTLPRLNFPRCLNLVVLLFLSFAMLPPLLRAQVDAGRDAALAKFVRILTYGDLIEVYKPTKSDAVVALGLLGDERAVPILIEHLKNEANDQLRVQIVRALGWIGSKTSVPALEEAARQDKYLHVRSRAAAALKDITGKDFAYDRTGEDESRARALEAVRARREATEKRANQASEPTAPSGRGSP